MIKLKLKTAFNYHENKGNLALALKIGLDHANVKAKDPFDLFIKRVNLYGEKNRNDPIQITDLPALLSTPEETMRQFSEDHKATIRIYSPTLKLTEILREDASVFIYLHEATPGQYNVIFKPHCLRLTPSGKRYKKHCDWCNTSHAGKHIKCKRGHSDLIQCRTCPLKYLPHEKHVCHHRKCDRCRIVVDARKHVCHYVAPADRSPDLDVISFDVGKDVTAGGRVVAMGVEVIYGEDDWIFTMPEFLRFIRERLTSKRKAVFVCESTDDLSLLYAESRQESRRTKGVFLSPKLSGNKITWLTSNGFRFTHVKSVIDVPVSNFATTFGIKDTKLTRLELRHRGQLAFTKIFLELCKVHPFAFQTKAQLAQHVYLRDHMPERSIPLVEDSDFDVPVGGGLNPCGYSKYVCKDGEQIHKYDFDSMYPGLMMSKPYPKGLPTPLKITPNLVTTITDACLNARPHEDRIQELTFAVIDARNKGSDTAPLQAELKATQAKIDEIYKPLPFGLLKVEIDAPPKRSLRHALLRIAGKHQFKRGVITVCTPELYRAIGLGYKLLNVIRGRMFKQTRTDLFDSFVKTFWKMKIEATGFPIGTTQKKRDVFVNDCLTTTGIQLDQENVKVNPGLRQVAKMLLNTLWGKFAEKCRETELHCVTEAGFVELHKNERYDAIE